MPGGFNHTREQDGGDPLGNFVCVMPLLSMPRVYICSVTYLLAVLDETVSVGTTVLSALYYKTTEIEFPDFYQKEKKVFFFFFLFPYSLLILNFY